LGSDYVVLITSIDGASVVDTQAISISNTKTITSDYVFSIASIYKSGVVETVNTAALDRVITITSIESGTDGIGDAGSGTDTEYATITTDSVVAISSIEDTTDGDSPIVTIASDYIVTFARIERADTFKAESGPKCGRIGSNCVVTLARIERARVEKADANYGRIGSNYVITLARIERAGVDNAARAANASNYVATLRRIERAGVEKAVFSVGVVRLVNGRNTSDCVVSGKSISDTCIEYLLHPRRGDNIILLSKR
jgi:hypothetical protein